MGSLGFALGVSNVCLSTARLLLRLRGANIAGQQFISSQLAVLISYNTEPCLSFLRG